MDNDKECRLSPDGEIFTKDGIYWVRNNELCHWKCKQVATLWDVAYDIVKTLYGTEDIPLYNPGKIERILEKKGWIKYKAYRQECTWGLHNSWNMPTEAQIAAALAWTGDKIGDVEDI